MSGDRTARDGAANDRSAVEGELSREQRRYDRAVQGRLRWANLGAWMRAGGIQAVWLTVLLAGAGIPLTEALTGDGWGWLSSVLGFVVVVAAGVERIFSRTSDAATALDRLRRQLARERRLFLSDSSSPTDARFASYVLAVEAEIAEYDRQMVGYGKRLFADPGGPTPSDLNNNINELETSP